MKVAMFRIAGRAVPIAVVMIAYASIGRSQEAPSLAGVWRLVSYEAHDANGRVQFPMGEKIIGQLIYDPAGHMCASLMREDRAKFVSGDRLRGTDLEVRTAFEGYLTYFGTYVVDPTKGTITHHVDGSLFRTSWEPICCDTTSSRAPVSR